jgi:hypothetical protein
MSTVPTTNLNAFYANTTAGIVADPTKIDAAFMDIVQTVNDNWQAIVDHIANPALPHADGSVTAAKLAIASVTDVKLAPGAVSSGKILDGAVITAKLADGSVTTIKIADGSVITSKLADGAVTLAKMASGSVGAPQLMDGSVTGDKYADGSITASKLGIGSVTREKIASAAVGSAQLDPALFQNWGDIAVQAQIAELQAGKAQQTEITRIDTELAEKEQQISDLSTNKADKTEVNSLATNKADKTEVNSLATQKANQSDLEVERARINSFTTLAAGSTTGDAELIDGRVGANGITYANIGGAIRGQLREKPSLVDSIIPREKTINAVITESVEYGYFYESTAGVKTAASASWWVQPLIPIQPNTSYRKSSCQAALYDANKAFISYVLYATTTFTTPSNCAYIGITANTDVNIAGLYENSKYTGSYVKGEKLIKTSQIYNFTNDTIEAVTADFIKRTKGKNLANVNAKTSGFYIQYWDGGKGTNANYAYLEIPVTSGQAYAINSTANIHVAFFNKTTYSQSAYISGVLNQATVTAPVGAVMMTVSFRPADNPQFQVELGAVSTGYEAYQYGLAASDINNKTVTREKLSDELSNSIGAKTVNVGTGFEYTSILAAMKANSGKNIKFVIHSGVYDLVAEYQAYYGSSYFTNYAGYATSDNFDKGLYLNDGVSMIGMGNVEIVFNYTGGNVQVHNRFAPINTTQNNLFENINITIGNACSRYGIHDDFASAEGTNIFRNCIFKGTSYLNTFMGCGMGLSNTYIIESCLFENAGGINIAYHNNVAAGAKNKLIIKDCYCNGAIRGASYGASTEISKMLVSGCYADNISVVLTDDTGNNINNIQLIQWNNTIF